MEKMLSRLHLEAKRNKQVFEYPETAKQLVKLCNEKISVPDGAATGKVKKRIFHHVCDDDVARFTDKYKQTKWTRDDADKPSKTMTGILDFQRFTFNEKTATGFLSFVPSSKSFTFTVD